MSHAFGTAVQYLLPSKISYFINNIKNAYKVDELGTDELQYLNSFVFINTTFVFLTLNFSLIDSLSVYVYIYLFEIDKIVSSAYIIVR